MDGAAATAEEAELRAALAARASEPRGVPVGAVLVHKRHISRLQRLLQPERLVAVDVARAREEWWGDGGARLRAFGLRTPDAQWRACGGRPGQWRGRGRRRG